MMGSARNDGNLQRTVFISLAAAGGLCRIIPSWLPLQWQLSHILSDDAFYYFTVARRLARDGFPSFDGLGATNGFHPLWLAVITPVYTLPIGDAAALRLVLALCALLDTVSLLLLIRILRDLHTGFAATAVAGALYAFSPALLSHTGPLNGMETSLTMLFLFALLASFFAVLRNKSRWYASPGALGALMGLSVLARTDTILIVAALGVSLWLSRVAGRSRVAVRGGLAALMVVSPWLIWNIITFGTILQVSGEAYALSMSTLYQTDSWGATEYAIRFVSNLADVFRFFPVKLENATKLSLPYALQGVLIAGALLWTASSLVRRPMPADRALRTRLRLLLAPMTGVLLFILAHSLRTIALRGWYFAIALPVFYVLLGWIVDHLVRSPPRRGQRSVILVGGVILFGLIGISTAEHLNRGDGERSKFDALPAVMEAVPRGARIGSWNAGVYGYFLKERTVINLDGLVNNAAYPHLADRSLGKYCRSTGISYLVDMAGAFRVWDPFWSDRPGSLARSLRTLRVIGAEGSDTSVVIAAIRMSPFPGE